MGHTPSLSRLNVGIRISARLSLLASRLVMTATATFGRLGLGSVDARVLVVLDCGPVRAVDICQIIGVNRSAVSRAVKMLVARGLVSRTEEKGVCLSLTGDGVRLCRAVKAVTDEREARLLEQFSHEDLDTLLDFLHRLSRNAAAVGLSVSEMEQVEGHDALPAWGRPWDPAPATPSSTRPPTCWRPARRS